MPAVSRIPNTALHGFDHLAYMTENDPLRDRTDLDSTQLGDLRDLLMSHKEAFSTLPGLTSAFVHRVRIPSEATPVNCRPYPESPAKRELLRSEVERLLKLGVIVPSVSAWSSPAILVNPKNPEKKTKRLCLDLRRINKLIVKDSFPMPTLEEILNTVHKPKYISTLDLSAGFMQVKVAEQDQEKLSFSCSQGSFRFTRMVFGERNSPSSFNRCLQKILPLAQKYGILIYMDDLIVPSDTWEEHTAALKYIFSSIRNAGMTLRLSKCNFAVKSAKISGFIVDENGLSVDPDRTAAIRACAPPTSIRKLREFLGASGFLRRFIPGYANIAKPLTRLLHQDQPWHWNEDEQAAFDSLKDKLVNPPVLATPDDQGAFTLSCDASNYAIGSMLTQEQNGVQRVIAYASRTLTANECKQSASFRKALACVTFCEKFRAYLEGRTFTLVTDHNALSALSKSPDPFGVLGRFSLRLMAFDFKVVYRPGKTNLVPDFLSRNPPPSEDSPREGICPPSESQPGGSALAVHKEGDKAICALGLSALNNASGSSEPPLSFPEAAPTTISQTEEPREPPAPSHPATEPPPPIPAEAAPTFVGQGGGPCSRQRLITMQKEDNGSKKIRFLLESGGEQLRRKEKAARNRLARHYLMRDDVLFRKTKQGERIYLPNPLRSSAMENAHEPRTSGHMGVHRTTQKLRSAYFWPRMHIEIRNYVTSCVPCQKFKPDQGKPKGLLHSPKHEEPFRTIYVDHLGPLIRSSRGMKYLLDFQCAFTRYCELIPCRDSTAVNTAKALIERIYSRHGAPLRIISDSGPAFRSHVWEQVCVILGIKNQYCIPYWAQANRAERAIRDILKVLSIYARSHKNWDENLCLLQHALNTAQNATTNISPFYLVHGRLPHDTGEFHLQTVETSDTGTPPASSLEDMSQFAERLKTRLSETFEYVRNVSTKNLEKYALHYNDGRSDSEFGVGDLVLVRTHHQSSAVDSFSAKLAPLYDGPYEVSQKKSAVTYELTDVATNKVLGLRHIQQMKAFYRRSIPEPALVQAVSEQTLPLVTENITALSDVSAGDTIPETTRVCNAPWCTSDDGSQDMFKCHWCNNMSHDVCAGHHGPLPDFPACAQCARP